MKKYVICVVEVAVILFSRATFFTLRRTIPNPSRSNTHPCFSLRFDAASKKKQKKNRVGFYAKKIADKSGRQFCSFLRSSQILAIIFFKPAIGLTRYCSILKFNFILPMFVNKFAIKKGGNNVVLLANPKTISSVKQ